MKEKIIALLLGCVVCACNGDFGEIDEPETPGHESTVRATVKAVDYNPAPGQFVNEMPPYEAGDTRSTMNQKALEALNRGALVSLGALGGTITITLAEPIVCDPAREADFRILGNAYFTGEENGKILGSSEPGIVRIMEDTNRNGIPDDEWYSFGGDMAEHITSVEITYTPVAKPTSQQWVEWVCDDATSGYLTCNTAYHAHTYFPMWLYDDVEKATMTVSAHKIPANGFVESSSGLFRQICYAGYADSFPNNDIRSAFSIRDAVDKNGKKANISRIDFISITTAVIDSNGPLGETSTEVGGIEVLH